MLSEDNVFAIKYFYYRSIKYRILTEDRNHILIADFRTFQYFIKNDFVEEKRQDGLRIYILTEKALNYKFKKSKDEK